MKKQDTVKSQLSKDFYGTLEFNASNSMTCSKEIYDELKSSVEGLGKIISRMKNRDQLNDYYDKMDLENIVNLSKHLKNMLGELEEFVSKS